MDVIRLDFNKEFGKAAHNTLVKKMHICGLYGTVI